MSILTNYTWPGPFTPFEHQKKTSDFIVNNHRGFVFNEMGLGKSASLLWAVDYLMQEKEIRRVLIVAPLSTLNRVWRDEAFKLLMHRNTVVLYGNTHKRRELYASPDWEIGIVNFDGLRIIADYISQDSRLDMIVVDEASTYRNTSTKRFKLFKSLADRVPRLILMTGTPCPEAPTDAFGLATLVGSPLVPKFYGAWRRQTMQQVSQFKWVPKPDGYKQAFAIMQPAVRFKKSDCLDLPPLVYEDWEVDLTPEQRAAYRSMMKKMLIEFAEGGDNLSAVNAADRINKLRQIACGVVRDTVTDEYVLLNHQPRVNAVLEAIEQANAKVIVVVPFKGIIYELAKEIGQQHTVAIINGDVSVRKRDDIVNRFRHTADPHVLLVHPKVMAHGLTLTEADVMVFYAPIYSGEESRQIIERINRPGQRHNMTIIRLGATKLEWQIYELVNKKTLNENSLLDMYKKAMHEHV